MADAGLQQVLQYLRRASSPNGDWALDDPLLLERFARLRDEAAFEVLVRRHGGMVLDVCRRLLRNHHDVEDAFQASFLVLVRHARSIRKSQALASWLYKVAYRVSLRLRKATAQRGRIESLPAAIAAPIVTGPEPAPEVQHVLYEELNQLRDKYRLPVVLCYLKGLTTAQAAQQLGCPQGTIHSRLWTAREQLRKRLIGRGVVLPTAGLSALLWVGPCAAAVPERLVFATIRTATLVQSGTALPGAAVSKIVALAEGVSKMMFIGKLRLVGAALVALSVFAVGMGQLPSVLGGKPSAKASVRAKANTVELSQEAAARLGIQVGQIKARGEPRPRRLPPFAGVLNYDVDRVFVIRSRFPGEVTEIRKVPDSDNPGAQRSLRVGDKVKQGDVLAVVWSQQLGAAKAALMDAVCAVRLSKDHLERFNELFQKGAIPLVTVKAAQKQFDSDTNTLLTAERSLRMWKLDDKEIQALRAEADELFDPKKPRDAKAEARLARLEIRAPIIKTNPNQELMVAERNVQLNDMVKPSESPPLFKLADTSRLEIWVHPPEEHLPLLRKALAKKEGGRLQWEIRLGSKHPYTPTLKLDINRIFAIDGNQPTLGGYLPNPKGKYLVGQFVTATILLPAEPELAVPASALVEEGGKAYVLIQPDPAKLQYSAHRVTIVRRDRDVVHLRPDASSDLSGHDASLLRAGQRVVTSGAAELKALLVDLNSRGK
jgi:RNA polymerase sigma factor (sigma-70 family)